MPSGEGNENSQNKSVALISQKKTMHVIVIIMMTLFNEGNTKQPKANKLMALKTQSYKYIISILIKTLKNYLQCIKRLQNRCKKKITALLLEYIFAQSALLYALLFVIINIYSVYSIYFGVGHFNFIQGYMLYK